MNRTKISTVNIIISNITKF